MQRDVPTEDRAPSFQDPSWAISQSKTIVSIRSRLFGFFQLCISVFRVFEIHAALLKRTKTGLFGGAAKREPSLMTFG